MKRFLDFTEIRTKTISVLVFLLTLSGLFYLGHPLQWGNTLLFFGSMFLFDLTATAINNYMDSKNGDETLPFSRKTAKVIVYVLFSLSTALGLLLAWRTDAVVFLLGGLCFLCGVCYTWGPVPISRLPLGEIFSGLFYGLFIPFLLLYINLPAGTLLAFTLNWETIGIQIQFVPLLSLLLFAVSPACATANIMLANNLCDLEKDRAIGRYTLAHFLEKHALNLFAGLYYAAFLAFTALVIFRNLSPVGLLAWLALIPIQKNIRRFRCKQDKQTTFALSVQNFVWLIGTQTLLIFISGVLKRL